MHSTITIIIDFISPMRYAYTIYNNVLLYKMPSRFISKGNTSDLDMCTQRTGLAICDYYVVNVYMILYMSVFLIMFDVDNKTDESRQYSHAEYKQNV